jgi:hypothetical protein
VGIVQAVAWCLTGPAACMVQQLGELEVSRQLEAEKAEVSAMSETRRISLVRLLPPWSAIYSVSLIVSARRHSSQVRKQSPNIFRLKITQPFMCGIIGTAFTAPMQLKRQFLKTKASVPYGSLDPCTAHAARISRFSPILGLRWTLASFRLWLVVPGGGISGAKARSNSFMVD